MHVSLRWCQYIPLWYDWDEPGVRTIYLQWPQCEVVVVCVPLFLIIEVRRRDRKKGDNIKLRVYSSDLVRWYEVECFDPDNTTIEDVKQLLFFYTGIRPHCKSAHCVAHVSPLPRFLRSKALVRGCST